MSERCRICAEIGRFDAGVKVRETASAVVVVPERVRVQGSVMVVVQRHVSTFEQLNDSELSDVAELIHDAARRILKAFRADGLNLWWATGSIAGQVDPHFFVELVPRFANVPYKFVDTGDLVASPEGERRNTARQLVMSGVSA